MTTQRARCSLLLIACACSLLLSASATPPPIPSEVWPQPAVMSTGTAALPLSPTFAFSCSGLCPAPLPAALDRFSALLFFAGPPLVSPAASRRRSRALAVSPATSSASPSLASLVVTVVRDAALSPLDSLQDEAYNLTVPADGSPAVLRAATQWGALRGLESFVQLCVWAGPDDALNAYVITAAPVDIVDAPRFPIRAVLIDTSFNFLTVQRIYDVLDSMSVTKSNVLHWHALDDPAWPMASSTFPTFTAPGGGGPYAQVAVYSTDDQAAIGAYAWARGVSIVFEYDVPGHSASWGAGNASLVVACDGHQTLINPAGEVGEEGTFYSVLGALMAEFGARAGAASAGLPWVHLGGDEVTDYSCWLQSAEVGAWAKRVGVNSSDAIALRAAFTSRVQAVAAAAGMRPLFWEESFTERNDFGLLPSSIVTPWVHPDSGRRAVDAGHDIVVAVGYYLDQWAPPARTDQEWYLANVSYGYIDSWRSLYAFDPVESTGVAAVNASHVLGGIASAWGDNVDSSLGATAMLFPRSLAVGERLWSPASVTRVTGADDPALDAVAARLEHARCRLAQRGIGASPVGVAGLYGFCWSPAWEPSEPAQDDAVTLSSGALAAIIVATFAAGVAAAVAYASRGAIAAALCTPVAVLHSQGVDSNGAYSQLAEAKGAAANPSGALTVAASNARFVALDQFRGLTIVAMLFVNLYYGRSGLPPFFSHGITYMSGPDLIEPAFHFCVGFALRLVVLKRLAVERGTWWGVRGAIFYRLLTTRVFGLILLSMFFTEGWGQFDDWSDIAGFQDWLTQLVQNVQPYHTLTHIAFLTVWTFIAMTLGWRARCAQLVATTAIHITLHATFYFQWIKTYGLDEGGYFAFFGWAIEALVGSLAHDLVISWVQLPPPSGKKSAPEEEGSAVPLLRSLNSGDDRSVGDGEGSAGSADDEGSGSVGSGSGDNDDGGKRERGSSLFRAWRSLSRLARATLGLVAGGCALMALAYLLSCLGLHGSLNPVCFNGQRIYFWGGFGDAVPCSGVPTWGGSALLVAPPFAVPDPATNVVTMWTMTQRAGSATYHLFTAGTSLVLFAAMVAACELGVRAPAWWPRRAAARALGLHTLPEDAPHAHIVLRSDFFSLFGDNALAIYVMSDQVGNAIGAMLPDPCPNWYFIVWGEGLYIGVIAVCAAYLRKHRLFLRL